MVSTDEMILISAVIIGIVALIISILAFTRTITSSKVGKKGPVGDIGESGKQGPPGDKGPIGPNSASLGSRSGIIDYANEKMVVDDVYLYTLYVPEYIGCRIQYFLGSMTFSDISIVQAHSYNANGNRNDVGINNVSHASLLFINIQPQQVARTKDIYTWDGPSPLL